MKVIYALPLGVLTSCLPALAVGQTATQSITVPTTYDVALTGNAYAAAVSLTSTAPGSGVDGPATAQDAMDVKCHKTNFSQATTVGEVDCIDVTLRQGGPNSSSSGVLIDAQNTGLGFVSDTEMVASSLDVKTNALSMTVDIQQGAINKSTAMYGAVYTATAGTGDTAVLVQAAGSASWNNVIRGVDMNGHQYFSVDGAGNSAQDGTARIGKSLYVNGVVQASERMIVKLPKARLVSVADCGTTLQSTFDLPESLELSTGLPVGCKIDVIQGGTGAVLLEGIKGLHTEHMGGGMSYKTAERFAKARLLVDSPSTILVSGEVSAKRDGLALTAYEVGSYDTTAARK